MGTLFLFRIRFGNDYAVVRLNVNRVPPVPPSTAHLPSQIVPLLLVTGTPTAFPYSVHDPS